MVQKMDMITAYRTWNRVAETAGIVLFGSTSAARLPLNELIQPQCGGIADYRCRGLYSALHCTADAEDDFTPFWRRGAERREAVCG